MKQFLLISVLAGSLSACVVLDPIHPGRGHRGPPDHAPAHGYRHRYHDQDMEYDGGLGAYIVIGRPGIYFHNNMFWRMHEGVWQSTRALLDPWHLVPNPGVLLPPGLIVRHGHGKGHKSEDRDDKHKKGKDKKGKKDRD